MRSIIKIIKAICNSIDKEERENYRFVPPGHYYSPIPSLDEIKQNEEKIFEKSSKNIPGVDLNEEAQLNLLIEFTKFYNELPFTPQKQDNLRYYFDNPAYSYSDGIFLYCMIRYIKPKKIIEIGSGYSTCLMLDVNELYFNDKIKIISIEPYPDTLFSLIKSEDKKKIKLYQKKLQDIELELFKELDKNDILFIDSTHVSKIYSDVNRIFFEVLPSLAKGVYIHFHDIFFPFEYPKEWIYEGRAWNEAYILRAFLQFNKNFEVVIMNSFIYQFYKNLLKEKMPLCLKNQGASIWIKKIK